MKMHDRETVQLPSADEFTAQIERLVKVQELAGAGVQQLYFRTIEGDIWRAECLMPGFGVFSLSRIMTERDYAIIDCILFEGAVPASEWPHEGARYLTLSRSSLVEGWTFYGQSMDLWPHDLDRLADLARETPRDVFERLFDLWFYDYPGLVPDAFTLENIEEIYSAS